MKFWLKLRAITVVKCEKMMCYNPNLDLIHMDACIKFGKNLLVCPQDIKRKQSFFVNQGP